MAGSIKGLTVEIGGDTTKLGKALDNVNKKSKNLSTELGQINRLLKMDPGNADLLAQKQKILADAVENTKEKLETLKKANEQASKSAENYDAWKAKYEPISAEIDEVTQKLRKLKAQQAELAESEGTGTEAYQQMQAEVDGLTAKLKTLRNDAAAVNKEFGNPASPEQLRELQREIVATSGKLKSYEKAAEETAQAIENMGKAGDNVSLSDKVESQAAELKQLKRQYVDVATAQGKNSDAAKALRGDIEALSKELSDNKNKLSEAEKEADKAAGELDDFADAADKAESSGGGLGKTLGGALKTGFTVVTTVCAAAIAGLAAAAESTREYRTEMGKLDTAFTQNGFTAGQARTAYTELVGILGETDQSVEAANHLAKLTDNEKELATWTGDILPGLFATFGDSLPLEGLTEAA